jgi:hypothetical protein
MYSRDKIVTQLPYVCELQSSIVYYLDKVVNRTNHLDIMIIGTTSKDL